MGEVMGSCISLGRIEAPQGRSHHFLRFKLRMKVGLLQAEIDEHAGEVGALVSAMAVVYRKLPSGMCT